MHGILSENDKIALYLEQAKSLIDHPDKWCKGRYEDDGRRCAVQAIRDVALSDTYLINKLVRVLTGDDEEAESTLCNYNDHRTHSELMGLFDGTISRLRSLSVLRTSV